MLQAGFARIDITPPLGITVAGYYRVRIADGILDPLLATAVAFDDGEKRSVILSVDNIGLNRSRCDRIRKEIAEKIGTVYEGVYIACTHTHLGPQCNVDNENVDYLEWLYKKLVDVATLAVNDLAPAEMSYTRGEVKDVAFIRRFRMKDGSTRTNPGRLNPDIDAPIGEPDENSSLLILKRDGKPEIAIVNFQVHPDVISGCAYSADYPKFVRDTYEKLIDNSVCMYLNGAQGDTNHLDVRLSDDECFRGYKRAQYMGRKIAMSVVANYELAKKLPDGKIKFGQFDLAVKHNKGREDQIEESKRIFGIYNEKGAEAAVPELEGMQRTTVIAEARRIVTLMDKPDEIELPLVAHAIGEVVFAGFPGEPFTEVGRYVKENSKFTLTMASCCSNGYEGYYPVQSAYDEGGYEARTARYQAGTAEKIMKASAELVNSL